MSLCKCNNRTPTRTMSPRLASPTVHVFFCFWQRVTDTPYCIVGPFMITARMHNMTTWKMVLFHLDWFLVRKLFFMDPTEMACPWVYCEFITNIIDAIHTIILDIDDGFGTHFIIIRSISSPFQNEDPVAVPDSMYAIQSSQRSPLTTFHMQIVAYSSHTIQCRVRAGQSNKHG